MLDLQRATVLGYPVAGVPGSRSVDVVVLGLVVPQPAMRKPLMTTADISTQSLLTMDTPKELRFSHGPSPICT
jgi:hypothetical protein